jgi:hypothetical protein
LTTTFVILTLTAFSTLVGAVAYAHPTFLQGVVLAWVAVAAFCGALGFYDRERQAEDEAQRLCRIVSNF